MENRPPHILFLMDDQHRFDWFGYAGHPVVKTPNLDALAEQGVVFENAYTPAPLCIPARQCLASGQFPRDCGAENFGEDLPPGSETFAKALGRVGYQTVCAGKLHHHGPDQPLLLKVSLQQPHYPFCAPEELVEKYLPLVKEYENQECLDHPECRNWTHDPEGVSEEDRLRALAATAAMVEICDEHFGLVMQKIRDCGQNLDDWLIVYCSDHGDMLGEHGKWWKMSFYEGSVKVPLILSAPSLFKGGRRLQQNVNLCDLFATLAEVAEAPVPEGIRSRSLMPVLKGGNVEWADESVSQYGGRCLMIKQGGLKYQWYGPEQEEVLFDLEKDPLEIRNAVDDPEHGIQLAHFRQRMVELGFT